MKEKLLSGRFILTIAAAGTFLYCSIKGILEPQAISAIVGMVFMRYFDRSDRKAEGTNGAEPKTPSP